MNLTALLQRALTQKNSKPVPIRTTSTTPVGHPEANAALRVLAGIDKPATDKEN